MSYINLYFNRILKITSTFTCFIFDVFMLLISTLGLYSASWYFLLCFCFSRLTVHCSFESQAANRTYTSTFFSFPRFFNSLCSKNNDRMENLTTPTTGERSITEIRVGTSSSYSVYIGPGLLDEIGPRAIALCPSTSRFVIVTDSNVAPLYAEKVMKSFLTAFSQAQGGEPIPLPDSISSPSDSVIQAYAR